MSNPHAHRVALRADVVALVAKHGVTSLLEIEQVVEEVMIRSALAAHDTFNGAARTLSIGKSTMYRKMKAYGIPKKRSR